MAAGLVIITVVWHSTGTTTLTTVHLAGDGVGDVAELLLLLLKVLSSGISGVLFDPVLGFFDGFEELLYALAEPFWILKSSFNLQLPCHRRQSCHRDPPCR
jgi:hypothetical protein